MSDEYRYRAFLATIAALVTMFIGGSLLALGNRSVEAIGVSGAISGLIALAGVLAGGKQQGDEMREWMNTALNRLADSTPPAAGLLPPPQQVEAAVERGAREGTEAGVERAISDAPPAARTVSDLLGDPPVSAADPDQTPEWE